MGSSAGLETFPMLSTNRLFDEVRTPGYLLEEIEWRNPVRTWRPSLAG